MARAVWKGPFVDGYILKKADKVRASGRNEIIRIWSRPLDDPAAVRRPDVRRLQRPQRPGVVTEDMINMKFGEFAPTRTSTGTAATGKR